MAVAVVEEVVEAEEVAEEGDLVEDVVVEVVAMVEGVDIKMVVVVVIMEAMEAMVVVVVAMVVDMQVVVAAMEEVAGIIKEDMVVALETNLDMVVDMVNKVEVHLVITSLQINIALVVVAVILLNKDQCILHREEADKVTMLANKDRQQHLGQHNLTATKAMGSNHQHQVMDQHLLHMVVNLPMVTQLLIIKGIKDIVSLLLARTIINQITKEAIIQQVRSPMEILVVETIKVVVETINTEVVIMHDLQIRNPGNQTIIF